MGFFKNLFKSDLDRLQDAARRGDADAQLNLGYMYETGQIGGMPDYAASMKWYLKAAAQGNSSAMNNIGWAYHQGLGVEPDQYKAREWFERAVAGGCIYAMSNLGIAYLNGMYALGDSS